MKNFLAFTLAETLIVMGVIGIVAALTLPNLNSSTGDKEKVAKVKKIYQNLNDAFGRAEVVYGSADTWCVNYSGSCKKRVFGRLLEFIKLSKICETVSAGCNIILDEGSDFEGTEYAAILADGTVISFPNAFDILINIDGAKSKSIGGKNTFRFGLSHDKGCYTSGIMSNSSSYVSKNGQESKRFDAIEAADWVVNFDNMDYLKTSDGTTCPNGTKLTSGGNHSCK